jgi:hypothetical protein
VEVRYRALEASELQKLVGAACKPVLHGHGDGKVLGGSDGDEVAVAPRFLRLEPQLPVSVVGHQWPPNQLRRAYPFLQQRYAELVRSFLTTVAANPT